MAADALLIVPPLLKVVTGPLLGPALLAGAAQGAGFGVDVVDLNARWLFEQSPPGIPETPRLFVGDHDRPGDYLRELERRFSSEWLAVDGIAGADDVLSMRMSHETVVHLVERLVEGRLGSWLRAGMSVHERPRVLGVSVMYAGQVLPALVASVVARGLWPGVLVVWGGAHVTALCEEIVDDTRYGRFVDRFVFGYAERTWVDLLRAVRGGGAFPPEVARAGCRSMLRARDDGGVSPVFGDLTASWPGHLTLPAQSSRGCPYWRCEFCTYPSVEGTYRPLPLASSATTVALAQLLGAAVSFKDSLVECTRLEDLAKLIDGRVPWSACTKLSRALSPALLRRLAEAGCATLEVGLETLVPEAQRRIKKRQSWPLFLEVLDAAAAARISLVVNYMTGFPGVDADDELDWFERVQVAIAERRIVAKIEHNIFQLERRSKMAKDPDESGVRVTRAWPWSSVLEWEVAPKRVRSRLPVVP